MHCVPQTRASVEPVPVKMTVPPSVIAAAISALTAKLAVGVVLVVVGAAAV